MKDFQGFNANRDAEDLYNAMKGFGEELYLNLVLMLVFWTLIVVTVQVKVVRPNPSTDKETLFQFLKEYCRGFVSQHIWGLWCMCV